MKRLSFDAETCGEAWIEALAEVFMNGTRIGCEASSSQKIEDTFDSVCMIKIKQPMKQPRLSRGDTFGHASIKKTRYLEEVLDGLVDGRIGKEELINGKKVVVVPYTYHNRLCAYPTMYKASEKFITITVRPMDQLESIVMKLQKSPNSRRAQAMTWIPDVDSVSSDPPCLQLIACRVVEGRLLMQTYWRSNDLFKCFGANTYAMIELMQRIATELGVEVGDYVYHSASLHIYESDMWADPTKKGEICVEDVIRTGINVDMFRLGLRHELEQFLKKSEVN